MTKTVYYCNEPGHEPVAVVSEKDPACPECNKSMSPIGWMETDE